MPGFKTLEPLETVCCKWTSEPAVEILVGYPGGKKSREMRRKNWYHRARVWGPESLRLTVGDTERFSRKLFHLTTPYMIYLLKILLERWGAGQGWWNPSRIWIHCLPVLWNWGQYLISPAHGLFHHRMEMRTTAHKYLLWELSEILKHKHNACYILRH